MKKIQSINLIINLLAAIGIALKQVLYSSISGTIVAHYYAQITTKRLPAALKFRCFDTRFRCFATALKNETKVESLLKCFLTKGRKTQCAFNFSSFAP